MSRNAGILALLAGVALAGAPALAQNANPQLLSLSCAGCHGPAGHSPGQIPSIYGRSAESVAEILRDFREGKRPATVMNRISKGYSDEEIAALAQEIARWK